MSLNVDVETGVDAVILSEHKAIHDGFMDTVSYTATVGNGDNADLQFTTGTDQAHFTFFVSADQKVTVYLYEAPTTSSGTAVTAYNRRRELSANGWCTVVHTPSVSGTGTQLFAQVISAGQKSGGIYRSDNEFIFKASTKYLIRVSNGSGSSASVNIQADYYDY